MGKPALVWPPEIADWAARTAAVERRDQVDWPELAALADARLDLIKTDRLDRLLQRHYATDPPSQLATKPVRLAVLASSTVAHLCAAIRVAGLRRGLWIMTYHGDYGQYYQELLDVT